MNVRPGHNGSSLKPGVNVTQGARSPCQIGWSVGGWDGWVTRAWFDDGTNEWFDYEFLWHKQSCPPGAGEYS